MTYVKKKNWSISYNNFDIPSTFQKQEQIFIY